MGTEATAVYIGKVVQPHKPINENDNDKAHLDKSAPSHIHFCNANPEHQFIVDQILEPNQGVTYGVFEEDKPPVEGEEAKPAQEFDDEGNIVPQLKFETDEKVPKFICVNEVVREPKIHFFQVPRLGSYMAVRLEYQTCLFEEAYDAGVQDMIKVQEIRRQQDEDRATHEQMQAELKAQAEADGEPFKADEKKWEPISTKPYLTRTVQIVCCLNTMGQDRKFDCTEKLFALRTVQKYRDRWEQAERENLKADIARKVAAMEEDRNYKESYENLDQQALTVIEEEATKVPEGSEPMTEEVKNSTMKKARFNALTKTFYDPEGAVAHQREHERDKLRSQEVQPVVDAEKIEGQPEVPAGPKYYPVHAEQWKKQFLELRQNFILKHPRVLQTLFYLLGYTRDQICERGTNCLDFKLTKELINE